MNKPNRDTLKMCCRLLGMQFLMLLGIWVLEPAVGLTGTFLLFCALAAVTFLIERSIQKKQKSENPS